MESKTCATCGKTFYRPKRYHTSTWARRRFCSRKCSDIGRRKTRADSHATAEWRRLSDRESSCKPLTGGPGTWEREHIKPREAKKERKWSRRVNSNTGDTVQAEVYYSPVRVAL